MKKIIIHTELIKLRNKKQLFQINLPVNAKKITGILIAVNESVQVPSQQYERGVIDLKFASTPEVVYSERVEHPKHFLTDYHGINNQGLMSNQAWWFSGTTRDFFKVSIPIKHRMVEAFFLDKSEGGNNVDYQLNIYLELAIK